MQRERDDPRTPYPYPDLKISFWWGSFLFRNRTFLFSDRNFTPFFSHSTYTFNPHCQTWFMKAAGMGKCVDVSGEIYISSSFFPFKTFSYLIMSVMQAPLWQGTWREVTSMRVEDAGSKKDWSFMSTSCNCRCSFKNRSALIIVRLFKVFAFYFSKKKKSKWRQKARWGEVKVDKERCPGVLSLKGPYIAQQVTKGNFILLSYKCRKLCIAAP